MFDVIIGILFIVVFLWYLFCRKNNLNIPAPWKFSSRFSYFLLGKYPHVTLTNLSKKYGNIIQLQMGAHKAVLFSSYSTIQAIFSSGDFNGRPDIYTFEKLKKFGSLALGEPNATWRQLRKTAVKSINSFVNHHNLNLNFHSDISKISENLVHILLKKEGMPFDPTKDLICAIGNIIYSTGVGRIFDEKDEEIIAVMEKIEKLVGGIAGMTVIDIFPSLSLLFAPILKKAFQNMESEMKNTDKLVRERYSHYAAGSTNFCLVDSLFETLRDENSPITYENIVGLMNDFISGGIGTSTTMIRWTILLVTSFPEHQQKMQEEIDSVISKNRYPNIEDLAMMPFTRSFLLEVERYTSFIPFGVTRATIKDTFFQSYLIPKGTMIIPNVWSAHRDPTLWQNSHQFDPHRFLDDTGKMINRVKASKLLLFSTGPRKCPGRTLARLEIGIILATLLQRCSFIQVPGEENKLDDYIFGLMLIPKPYKIIVLKR